MIDELSRHATVRYEHGSGVTIDRLQGRDAREFDGVTMFGRVDEKLGRRPDHRRTALGCRGLSSPGAQWLGPATPA
jgi:hypothetical protein